MGPSGGNLWKLNAAKAHQFRPRLILEVLEDRLVPAFITVTTPEDVMDPNDGLISLREAIQQANQNNDHDDIYLSPSALNYQLKGVTPGTVGPSAFVINSDVTIVGSGGIGSGTTNTLSIDPLAPPMRFFWILPAGKLDLQDLIIRGGRTTGGSGGSGSLGITGAIEGPGGGGGAGLGGAIFNQGSLTIERVSFIDNQAVGGAGGSGSSTPSTSGFGGGGGGLSGPGQPGTPTSGGAGALNAGNGAGPTGGPGTHGSFGGGGGGAGTPTSAFGGNGGFGGGGGAYGGKGGYGGGNGAPLGATAGGGGGGAGIGGAIFNDVSGSITISNSTFINNRAFGGSARPGGTNGSGIGGSIANLNGTVTIRSSTFFADLTGPNQQAADQGGSLANIATNGLTATIISNNSIFQTSAAKSEVSAFEAPLSHINYSGNNNIVFNGSMASPLGILSNSNALLGTPVVSPSGAVVVPLLAGSPAIGTANPTTSPPVDQRQIQRQSTPSIGAYEYYVAPETISLSALSFAGLLQNGETIGILSAAGALAGTSFKYALVNGVGDNNNTLFRIRDNELLTTGNVPEGVYSIRVRATGIAGDYSEQNYSLTAIPDIVVTTPDDTFDPGDGKTSLREALERANLNPDHDRISFDNALNGIPIILGTVGSTVDGKSALAVSTPVTIQGSRISTDFTMKSGTTTEMRFFRVETNGSLRLENIDLIGGTARGDTNGDINGKGGAILAYGAVALVRSSIWGARVFGAGGANPGDAKGGAIYTTANLNLLESTLADNTLYRGNDSTVPGNYSPSPTGNYYGAGVYVDGTLQPLVLHFQAVTIAHNQGNNQPDFLGGAIAISPGLTAGSGPIQFHADALVVQSVDNTADIGILPGLGPLTFNVTNSFAGSLGEGVPTTGFTVGDPLLDYSTTGIGQSPVYRPRPDSPLIHAISNPNSPFDQTNLPRFANSAAGAAEYYTPPQGIVTDDAQLAERLPPGARAGSVKPSAYGDSGGSYTFELVSGPGDTDNYAFRLDPGIGQFRTSAQLYTTQSFLASGGNRSIRVRVTGLTGLSLEQALVVTISPSITVDTATDVSDPNDGKVSLREALVLAELQPGIDRITFAPSLAGQTLLVGPEETGSSSAFSINSSVLITAADAPGLTIQPTSGSAIRLFNVSPFTSLALEALTLQGGNIVNGEGGAILSDNGSIFLDSVTIRDNKASLNLAAGGAIRIHNGQLKIINSTFFNNHVENAVGPGPYTGEGGHILATTSSLSGEISISSDTETHYSIVNSTFSNGSATASTGGVAFIAGASTPTVVDVTTSVFAHSTGNDISLITLPRSVFSLTFNSNFVESVGGLPADINAFTGDPMLKTPENNGGPTPTMEPRPGSPLIANETIPPSNAVDQRGIRRGSTPTIGAYQVVQPTDISFAPTAGTLGIGSKVDFTVTFSHPVTYFGQPALKLDITGAQALAQPEPTGSAQMSLIRLQYTVREGDASSNLTASLSADGAFDARDTVNHPVTIPPFSLVTPVVIDGIRPVPTVVVAPVSGTLGNASSYTGAITFSETVSGTLLISDFKLTNATVSNITGPDAANRYLFTLAPIGSGNVEVVLTPNAVSDVAGNGSTVSNTVFFNSSIGATSDTTPPSLVEIATSKQPNPSYVSPQKFIVSFSEPVLGIDALDFSIITNNEFLSLPPIAGQQLTASLAGITQLDGTPLADRPVYSVLVTVNSSGRGTLSLELSAEATISDLAGNTLSAGDTPVAYGFFSVDTTPLQVVSIEEVASPRTVPVESIDIVLSKPLPTPSQLEPGIRLVRNGKNFPLGNALTIVQTGYASYRLENFRNRTGVDGNYQFLVSGANLRDPAGNLGTGIKSVSWIADGPLDVIAPSGFNPPISFYQFVTNAPRRILLGSFTDRTGGIATDYVAHANWGESGAAIPFDLLDTLEIRPSLTQNNAFDIFGTHTYTTDRNYLVNVLVKDTATTESFLFGFAEVPIVVLTELQASQQSASSVPPSFIQGQPNSNILTLSLFPDASANSPPLLSAVFNHAPPAGIDDRALFLTNYAQNPELKPLPVLISNLDSVEWLDLRATGVSPTTDPTAFLNASFAFVGNARQAVQLFYFNPLTNAYERVYSSGHTSPVVDSASGLIKVLFDSTSTPALVNLNGTVFAVTVSSAGSSNSSGGTAGSTDTTGNQVAVSTTTSTAQSTSTTSGSLVQASQTLMELARTEKIADSSSAMGSSALFVGGRSSTVSLTPSALGRGVSARTRSSAGSRVIMGSSKDAAMALSSILRGVIAPVEEKLKPWIEAFRTDTAKPAPMPDGSQPAPMPPPAMPQVQPPAGALPPPPNEQLSGLGAPGTDKQTTLPVTLENKWDDADAIWLDPMPPEYGVGLLPLAGALVLACSEFHARRKPRNTPTDGDQGAGSEDCPF